MKKKSVLKLLAGIILIIAILYIVFYLYKNKSESLPVKAKLFEAPKSGSASWEQVFKKPGNIKVERINTGGVIVKKSGLINLKHPNSAGTPDEIIEVSVFSYLIKHEKFGYFLVDAGLDASIQKNPYGNAKGILGHMLSYSQKEGMDVSSLLKKRQIYGNVLI